MFIVSRSPLLWSHENLLLFDGEIDLEHPSDSQVTPIT